MNPAQFHRLPSTRLLAAAFTVCVLSASAQQIEAPATVPSPKLAGIAHAAIRVSDLASSREFYSKLGFEEAFAMDQGGAPTEAFFKINDRQFLELYPQRQPTQAIGFMHVCFEASDIEGLNRYYLEHGLQPAVVRRAGAGNLLFTMEGPEKQNIEYTQYMPGSRHTNDIGKHLGPNRIAERILAAGIEMQTPLAAGDLYTGKLGFTPGNPLEPGQLWLRLPGDSGQQIEIVQHNETSAFRLFFAVANLRQTAARLKALQIPFEKHKSDLYIRDPDGNRLVFVNAN